MANINFFSNQQLVNSVEPEGPSIDNAPTCPACGSEDLDADIYFGECECLECGKKFNL